MDPNHPLMQQLLSQTQVLERIASAVSLGGVVRLLAGGPRMTVESISGDTVSCVWFEGNDVCKEAFHVTALRQA